MVLQFMHEALASICLYTDVEREIEVFHSSARYVNLAYTATWAFQEQLLFSIFPIFTQFLAIVKFINIVGGAITFGNISITSNFALCTQTLSISFGGVVGDETNATAYDHATPLQHSYKSIKGARYLLIIHELLVAMGFFSAGVQDETLKETLKEESQRLASYIIAVTIINTSLV